MSKCLDIPIIYILLRKRDNTFWPKGIDKFHSRGIQIFWALKIIEEYYFDTSKSFTDKSTKSIFTTTVNFFSILPNYYRHPPDFIIFQFYSSKLVLFLFSHLLARINPTILLDVMLQVLIPCISIFTWLVLLSVLREAIILTWITDFFGIHFIYIPVFQVLNPLTNELL